MRVAITGMGVVSPLGATAAALVEGLRTGRTGIRPAPWADPVDPQLFAAVADDHDRDRWLDERLRPGTDPFVTYALAACAEALDQARLGGDGDPLDPLRTAVVGGTSMGGFYSLMAAQDALARRGQEAVPPKTMLRIWSNMAASQVATRYALHGPLLTLTTACASALDAVGTAARLVEGGQADLALCGGTEGGYPVDGDFEPATAVAGIRLGVESTERDPRRAVLPFDVARSGIVFGEGAAWFVVESEASVRTRGATPLAWLAGYGCCAEGHHPVAPEPTGTWEARAMQLALDEAGLGADDVDLVVAHATGTQKGDAAEARALHTVHGGPPRAPVTSIKGHTGHTGASSGGMGLATALAVMADGVVPPTAGTTELGPDIDLDVVLGRARPAEVTVAQVNAFGFGGQDASVVVTAAG